MRNAAPRGPSNADGPVRGFHTLLSCLPGAVPRRLPRVRLKTHDALMGMLIDEAGRAVPAIDRDGDREGRVGRMALPVVEAAPRRDLDTELCLRRTPSDVEHEEPA